MVKELREELAAERELRDGHQKRADSLQVRTQIVSTLYGDELVNLVKAER